MLKFIKRLSPGLMILGIVFVFIQVASMLYMPYITADIVNIGVMGGNISYIWSKGFLMIGMTVLYLFSAALQLYLFSKMSFKLGSDLRADIFRKTLNFSKHEFDKLGTSSLVTRSTNDVTQVQNLVEMICKYLFFSLVVLFGGIFMTYLLSPVLSLIYLGAVPFLAISYYVIYRFANPLYEKMQKLLDALNRFFREGLTGVKIIRAFAKEEQEYEKYKAANREYTHTSVTAETIMSVFIPLITMLISMTAVIITWVAGKGINAGTMEVGAIIGAVGYAVAILRGFGMLTTVVLAIPRGRVSAKRINEVLDMPLSITDPLSDSERVIGHGGTLTFEKVDFRYQGASMRTLMGVDFNVRQGQTLAIIGSTGAGKSSLVNLLSRLYDVENGCIRIGGIDVREFKQKELHNLVSFSPQKATMFLGTVRSNMLLSEPDATDNEIWAALDIAQATEFVRELPKGLDSAVEKAGGNFSGGQKQRLCIARTLLKNASIYVFDDSFSALDFKTDANVRAAMRSKLCNAITVIVAQRISTVMDADMIAVLDNGKLVGLGTHEKLKESNPVYQEIIDSQFHKEDVAV